MKTNSIFYVLCFALIFSVKVDAQILGSQILPSGLNTINTDLDVNGNIDIEGPNEFLSFGATSSSYLGIRFYDGSPISANFDGGLFYRPSDDGVNLTSSIFTNGLRYNFATDNASVGVSLADQDSKFHVQDIRTSFTGGVIHGENTNTTNADAPGVRGTSTPADGYGYGVYGTGGYRGVYGSGQGGAWGGTAYGVQGVASGSAGTRVGVYGSASGGGTNWAMWAAGNSYVSGDLRIGSLTGATGYKVAVDGKIICEELKVETSSAWPDYVFEKEYELKSLEEVEASINENGHLPGIPSATQIKEDGGYHVGDMQRRTIEKVEELTLYLIESNKQMKALQTQNEMLLKRIEELENK